jgi:Polyketide cyclase / dehydrase and lipid transport
MLRTILLVVAAGVAALLVWVGLKPSTYRVERSAVINAAAADVYGHVYDFSKWQAWSPWAKLDPNAKVTFEGPTSGPGAIMRWAGNEKVGRGAMAMTEVKPGEAITIRLDFVEPMEGTSNVGFAFQPDGTGTRVTWTMDGTQGFVERLICTVMGIDAEKMIGADYERGLANLKTVAEASPPSGATPPLPAGDAPPG